MRIQKWQHLNKIQAISLAVIFMAVVQSGCRDSGNSIVPEDDEFTYADVADQAEAEESAPMEE